ncbi:MAG: replication initiator protein [Microvirus sp.]|nr:MAG: replication initiator protein [Microvirus sp.]
MPCYRPVDAWRPVSGGALKFAERGDCRPVRISCGQCIGCRLERSRQWAVRCMHEASLYDASSFVTLTYDDHFLPLNGSLTYPHFQRFLKRLRKKLGKVRFYMCGEYGDRTLRPHYHALLFGCFFDDREPLRVTDSGSQIWRSAILEKLWPYGYSSIGDVTFESAAYVARYCLKKATGPEAAKRYSRVDVGSGEVTMVEPEFSRMSLKPGIGGIWFDRFSDEVVVHKGVMMYGDPVGLPRFYKDRLRKARPFDADFVSEDRVASVVSHPEYVWDNSPERLAIREAVAAGKAGLKFKSLE